METNAVKLIAEGLFDLSSAENAVVLVGSEIEKIAGAKQAVVANIEPGKRDEWSIDRSVSKVSAAVLKIIADNNLHKILAELPEQYNKISQAKQKKPVFEVVTRDELPDSVKSLLKEKALESSIIYSIDPKAEETNLNFGWQVTNITLGDIAKSYAAGFVNIAKALQSLDGSVKELKGFYRFYENNFEIQQFLNNPYVSGENKFNMIYDLLRKKEISNFTKTFLWLLVTQKRQHYLPFIVTEIEKIVDDSENQVVVEITTAHEMSSSEKDNIISKFSNSINRKIIANFIVDENLIGGLKVQLGYQIFDGSVAARLRKIAKKLSNKEVGVA